MSLETIKEEVAKLSEKERWTLMSYIADLRHGSDDEEAAHRRQLAEEIDNKDSSNWVPWSDAKKQLRDIDEQESV